MNSLHSHDELSTEKLTPAMKLEDHMSETITRADCPCCHREIALRPQSGTFRTHGPVDARCPHSWRRPDEPLLADQLRHCWRIGDALAASRLTGIHYPAPTVPLELGADDYLAFVVADARAFIGHIARLSHSS
jgi:hypothetical protein